jgi:hypothetical protein
MNLIITIIFFTYISDAFAQCCLEVVSFSCFPEIQCNCNNDSASTLLQVNLNIPNQINNTCYVNANFPQLSDSDCKCNNKLGCYCESSPPLDSCNFTFFDGNWGMVLPQINYTYNAFIGNGA